MYFLRNFIFLFCLKDILFWMISRSERRKKRRFFSIFHILTYLYFGLFLEYCFLSYFIEKGLLLFILCGLRFLSSPTWRLFLFFLFILTYLHFLFLAVDYRSTKYLIFQILYEILINFLSTFLYFFYSSSSVPFPFLSFLPIFLSSLPSLPFSSYSITSIFIVLFQRSGIYRSWSAVTLFPSFSTYDRNQR